MNQYKAVKGLRLSPLIIMCAFMLLIGGCAASSHDAAVRSGTEQRQLNRDLIVAAYHADVPAVRRLLAAGAWGDAPFGGSQADRAVFASAPGAYAPFGADKWRPLHAAAMGKGGNQVAVVQLLLDAGADPDVDDGFGATPLYVAIKQGRRDVAMLLMERGANVNTKTDVYIDGSEGTPLHAAIRREDLELIRALLERGADVEAEASWGYLPLQIAAGHGCVPCIDLLMKAGADVNARGGWSRTTALLTATEPPVDANAAGVVRALLAAGADVNARSEARESPMADNEEPKLIRTPLLNAAKGDDPAVVSLLLAAGADAKAHDEAGNTALHLIADRIWWDRKAPMAAVKELIDAGARTDVKNVKGQTPLDMIPDDQRDEERVKAVIELFRSAARGQGGVRERH